MQVPTPPLISRCFSRCPAARVPDFGRAPATPDGLQTKGATLSHSSPCAARCSPRTSNTAGAAVACPLSLQTKGATHSQLFSIRQLLALREAIAPFEADFAVVERDLGERGLPAIA